MPEVMLMTEQRYCRPIYMFICRERKQQKQPNDGTNHPWYELLMVQIIHGTNSPSMVRIVHGTNHPWVQIVHWHYEQSMLQIVQCTNSLWTTIISTVYVMTDCCWPRFWGSRQSAKGVVVNRCCRRLLSRQRFAFYYSCIVSYLIVHFWVSVLLSNTVCGALF